MARWRCIFLLAVMCVAVVPRTIERHSHHCIVEESACARCLIASPAVGSTPAETQVASLDLNGALETTPPVFESRRPEPLVILQAPLRAPPEILRAA